MKKVLFIITKSEIGGAQTWVRDQVKLYGEEISPYLSTSESGWLSDSCTFSGVLFSKKILSKFSWIYIFMLYFYVKKNKIDVIVASSANAGLYARLISMFHGNIKCIYVSHGWSCLYNGGRLRALFVYVEKQLSKVSDIIWCVSAEDRRKAIEEIGIDPCKVVLARNSVFFHKIRIENKNKTKKKLNLLFVGRLEHPKRIDLIVDAIKDDANYSLTIVGAGSKMPMLGMSSNINCLGEVINFNDFSLYDALILISDSEGLPIAAIEGAAAGLPLILSRVGGCPELIREQYPNGILVNNNEIEIRKALKELHSKYEFYFENALEMSGEFNIVEMKHLYDPMYAI